MPNNVNRSKRLPKVRPRVRHTASRSAPASGTLLELWPASEPRSTPEWGLGQVQSQPVVAPSNDEIITSAVRLGVQLFQRYPEQMMFYGGMGLICLGLWCLSSAEANRRN
jgi:hypothetical protein